MRGLTSDGTPSHFSPHTRSHWLFLQRSTQSNVHMLVSKKNKKSSGWSMTLFWQRVEKGKEVIVTLWHVSSRVHTSSVGFVLRSVQLVATAPFLLTRYGCSLAGGDLTWSVLVQQINEWRYGNGRENCCIFIHFREELRRRRNKTWRLFLPLGLYFPEHSLKRRPITVSAGGLVLRKCGSGWGLDIKAYLKNHFAPAFIQSLFLFTCMIFSCHNFSHCVDRYCRAYWFLSKGMSVIGKDGWGEISPLFSFCIYG